MIDYLVCTTINILCALMVMHFAAQGKWPIVAALIVAFALGESDRHYRQRQRGSC